LSWLSCLSWRSALVPLQGVAAQSVPLIPIISCVLGCLGCLACLGCLCCLYVWVSLSLSLAWLFVSVLRFGVVSCWLWLCVGLSVRFGASVSLCLGPLVSLCLCGQACLLYRFLGCSAVLKAPPPPEE
jgi:hypothetical protein